MDIFARYAQYAPLFIAAVVFLALGIYSFFAGKRATADHPGGLDWVKQYGNSGIGFSGITSRKADWLCGFAVAVYAILAFAGHNLLLAKASSGKWLADLLTLHSLFSLTLAIAAAIAVWLLLQHLYDSSLISVCGSLLFSTVLISGHYGLCLLAISLIFMQRWLARDIDKPFFPGEILLYMAYLFLGFGAAAVPQLLWFAPLYIVLHLCRTIRRFRSNRKKGELIAAPLIALVVWAIAAIGMFVWLMMLYKVFRMSDFPALLWNIDFYYMANKLMPYVLRSIVNLPNRSSFIKPLIDSPVLFLGISGALTALLAFLRRRDMRAFLVVVLCGMGVLILALTGSYILTLPLILAIGYQWKCFESTGRRLPVILFTGICMVAYFALYAAAAYGLISPEILIRIY